MKTGSKEFAHKSLKNVRAKSLNYKPAEISFAEAPKPQWFTNSLRQTTLVFFDLETTGGNPGNSDVIEFAGVKYRNGIEVERYQTLVNPQRAIPHIVRKITGISDDIVANQPIIDEVIDDILVFIEDAVMVSHGVLNDFAFLLNYSKMLRDVDLSNYYLCTHLLVSNFFQEIPSKKLSGVAAHFGVEVKDKHRAMADAQVTADIFWHLADGLEDQGFRSLEDLLKIQGDQKTLSRLGSGLQKREIEKSPGTPGIITFFNSHREVIYVCASPNIKKTLSHLEELTQDRELNKILVDIADAKFERTPHFQDALFQEKVELNKLRLPIDPRIVEGRSHGLIQLLIPEDMVTASQGNKKYQSLLQLNNHNAGVVSLPAVSLGADIASEVKKANTSGQIPIRITRNLLKTIKTRSSTFRQVDKHLLIGALKPGVGWIFGTFENPKFYHNQWMELKELLAFDDVSLEMDLRFYYLHLYICALFGTLQNEIDFLKSEICAMGFGFNFITKYRLKQFLIKIETVQENNLSMPVNCRPHTGLTVVANNETKELDLCVVSNSRVRRKLKLPSDESDKMTSTRFMTRLFLPNNENIAYPYMPEAFSVDGCSSVELFLFWKDSRKIEGEWIGFEDIASLYEPQKI